MKNAEKLTQDLMTVFDRVQKGEVDTKHAHAMAKIANSAVNICKVQLNYNKQKNYTKNYYSRYLFKQTLEVEIR